MTPAPQTYETRTVTHSQFLCWGPTAVPDEPGPLLEFRRKVNKAHAGQSTPLLVHCRYKWTGGGGGEIVKTVNRHPVLLAKVSITECVGV